MIFSFLKSYWKYLVAILAVVLFYLLAYEHGATSVQRKWDAAKLAEHKHATEVTEKRDTVTTQVQTVYVDRIQVVKEKGDTIVKQVPVYITKKDDDSCRINVGFVRMWNAANLGMQLPRTPSETDEEASGVKLSDVASQHARESQYTKEVETQLESLQDWVSQQQNIK